MQAENDVHQNVEASILICSPYFRGREALLLFSIISFAQVAPRRITLKYGREEYRLTSVKCFGLSTLFPT